MLGKDRIPFVLGVGAIVVTLGVGTCSTNARIDDVNRRLDDLNADVNRRFDEQTADVNRRFDDVRADIRGLRADHRRFDERLRAVEIALGQVDQRLLTIERVVLPPASPGE